MYHWAVISQLRGTITHKAERYIILDVSGVGYRLYLSAETLRLARADSGQVMFWTHLVVREDALDLYGFTEPAELDFFELLIGVSGIGPKSALAILSLAPPETLRRAIASGDSGLLTKVSGIGRKSAEKIIIELRDKLADLPELSLREDLERETDAIEGLQALGYSLREAREALRKVPDTIIDPSERIRAALKVLGK